MDEQLQEALDAFYQQQFMQWPDVAASYARLSEVKRRCVKVGDSQVILQCNPARIVSTGADMSKVENGERPCFLCEKNRPKEQLKGEGIEGFDILINPYPIFPVHLTIASKEHALQGEMPLEMVDFAARYPGLVAFYNGAKAGASAPDHLHFQAVRADELPLLSEVEKRHPSSSVGKKSSAEIMPNAHAPFVSIVIPPDMEGMKLLAELPKLHGQDAGLVNTFVWIGSDGVLRSLIFGRKAHRPTQYYAEGEERLLVSPGALDMAGVMILPREEDFQNITAEQVADIYQQVSEAL